MTTSDRETRAAAARQAILDSGDPDLIKRLHLMDAAAASQGGDRTGSTRSTQGDGQTPGRQEVSDASARPGPWGTAAAAGAGAGLGAMGGMMLGTVLGGMVLNEQMRAAFATLAEDAGFDPGAIDVALGDAAPDGAEPGDDLTQASHDAPDGGFDGDADDGGWLSGLFDI